MMIAVALLPILVLLVAILAFRRSVIMAATLALMTLIIGAVFWGMGAAAIAAASTRGLFLTVEIVLILLSAILIFEILEHHDISGMVRQKLEGVSGDYRVQTLLISLGVVYFMEGVAGFGTPAIIAVPLFIALGFKPLHSVILTLVSDSIPVSFGAVGLPITYGVGSVLETVAADPSTVLSNTVVQVALLNGIGLVLLSLYVLYLTVKMNGGGWPEFRQLIPFAVVSSLIVSSAALLTALIAGAELTSIVGGLVGIIAISFMAKKKILLPPEALTINQTQRHSASQSSSTVNNQLLVKSFLPYLLLILLLLITRLPSLGVGDFLRGIEWSMPNLFGSGLDYTIAPLYSVASVLLVSALFALALFHENLGRSRMLVGNSFKLVKRPFMALLLMLIFVQIFILSGNSETAKSMPLVIAEGLSNVTGATWPLLAPFVGALGSFIAGSATVSNLVFSGLQYDVAINIAAQPATILSLQSIGSALGNMVALHNIIAALAIARLSEEHVHKVIRANVKPLFFLLTSMAVIGLLVVTLG